MDASRAVLEPTAAGAMLRRRVGAVAACVAVVCAALVVAGLGVVVFVGVVVGVAAAACVVIGALARRAEPRVGATRRALTAGAPLSARAARDALALGTRRLLGELLWTAVLARSAAAKAVAAAQRKRARPADRPRGARRSRESLREALQLNATGVGLRRSGDAARAVECHRAALGILQELGDSRAVALTQSNIALALEQAGDDNEAIARFEQAISLLRDLGDEEREAQVTANLGVVHLRQGRRDVAHELLSAALEKLGPDSVAHAQVERQLQRAS